MIELHDIAYVRSGVTDLERAEGFAVHVVGLEPVAREPGVTYLRADHRHHCVALIESPQAGVHASAFTLKDVAALEAAEIELTRYGCAVRRGSAEEARQRHVRAFIAFEDPFGNQVELVTDQSTLARPIEFGRPAAGIAEFGHLCLDAPDVRAAHEFWSTVFSAKVSDWIGDAACLMRIDPVHHKLALFQNDAGPGLCHINFQVHSLDDVMRNWRFLQRNDVRILHGPGRHPTSTAIFVYFVGPDNLTYEYSFGVRRIEDDAAWRPRTFNLEEDGSIDMWLGPTQRTVTQPQLAREAQNGSAAGVPTPSGQAR
ncbi:VOC family protein [Mycobacterium paraseoulense]|uniref:Glyoxalase n=1 Tax=Mycobacterium paraseoulense TaxID=590652 RepID=A0A1X0I7V6_9MYCO|nr:VOC family protein [Mycobacterium paraseoulense]ORB38360.1 glyoxalase [Mycobacterium paraseoulense]